MFPNSGQNNIVPQNRGRKPRSVREKDKVPFHHTASDKVPQDEEQLRNLKHSPTYNPPMYGKRLTSCECIAN